MSGPFRRKDFDAPAFYAALNKIRNLRDFTWKEVSTASGVSTTNLSRMADGRHPDAASLASLSHWAGMNPANFMADPDKPPYDTSLAAIAARLRNSITWLRDGTPTTGGGIGLGDMIALLPIVDAALASPPPQATGALSDTQVIAMNPYLNDEGRRALWLAAFRFAERHHGIIAASQVEPEDKHG